MGSGKINGKWPLRPPIKRFGGKGMEADKIINLFPEHESYVEVFGGTGVILLNKKPSLLETFNDLDKIIYDLYKTLQDETLFNKLVDLLEKTPYSRDFWNDSKDWESCEGLEKIYKYIVCIRQSYAGKGDGWGVNHKHSKVNAPAKWQRMIAGLPEIHERIKNVQIENSDFRQIIKRYDTDKTFFYLDPPYLHETRTAKNDYKHEMTNDDHNDLLDLILNCKGKVLLSGYDNPLYNEKLKDWQTETWQTVAYTATTIDGKRPVRFEKIWRNYDNGKLF